MKSKQTFHPKKQDDSKLQLEQKILHYRSEVAKYKKQAEELRSLLKAARQKGHTGQKEGSYSPPVSLAAKAYFSYSTFFPKQGEEQDNQIHAIGHFTFENTGNQILHDPVFCFRTKPANSVNIGGKIRMTQALDHTWMTPKEEWVYVQNDWKEWVKTKGEHWLKPVHIDTVKPGEKAIFSNFDMAISPGNKDDHILIEGFCYARELQKGIASVNTISLYL
ncbi:hypothetical protein JSY36_09840 [Bacillus sp. H-16]|uniref:hypothetical protein n=1 Tax=Alteribacter salitolerans TaxID=2912333 RepID=UPI001966717F|nr:hypothetical protein [Alteribacter salitolerans]MBM7096056.1 hypothetical protein [Alteribacter salitolerans]